VVFDVEVRNEDVARRWPLPFFEIVDMEQAGRIVFHRHGHGAGSRRGRDVAVHGCTGSGVFAILSVLRELLAKDELPPSIGDS
jgi:hypothetical protein